MSDQGRKSPKITSAEFPELLKLFDAWQALKRLGWKEPRYFRFTDEEFELIELGSTGIHRAVRRNNHFWVDGDWPSQPFLVREIKKAVKL